MTTQHTPWKLWNGYGPLPGGKYAVARIGPDSGGLFDGLVGSEGHDIIGTKEDLEYVVQAVNSHDALLAAMEALASVLRNFTMYNGMAPDSLVVLAQEAMRQYLAAIKLAKAGAK